MKKHLRFAAAALALAALLAGCGEQAAQSEAAQSETAQAVQSAESAAADALDWDELQPTGTLALEYAQEFTVDEYDGGLRLVTVHGDRRYLVVPEGAGVPQNLPEDVVVLQQPLQNIYLAATSAMDMFRALGQVGRIRFSAAEADGWYVDEAKAAMESGAMLYAGKYSAPDYELILSEGCGIAVESTMIYHKPEVKEKLESLGIPVLVEYSSYEPEPLGRMEWVKLYGVLLGGESEQAAQTLYAEKLAALEPTLAQEDTGRSAAYFAVTTDGAVTVRKPTDYVSRMIELAGGHYLPDDLGDDADDSDRSTTNIQMERFYAAAKDADVLIYNTSIQGEITGMADLLQKAPLLADFKAVQNGEVYVTGRNLFQSAMELDEVIRDFHTVLAQTGEELAYLEKLGE